MLYARCESFVLGYRTPQGSKCNANLTPLTTMLCPAFAPPYTGTMSRQRASTTTPAYVESRNRVEPRGEDVDELALAFVAPLRAEHNGDGHDGRRSLSRAAHFAAWQPPPLSRRRGSPLLTRSTRCRQAMLTRRAGCRYLPTVGGRRRRRRPGVLPRLKT